MAANSQPARAISRKRGCSQSAIQTSRRKSAAVEPSFPIPFQRGIGDGSFPFEGLYTALYVQGVLQNASDPGNNVALYVQGGIPDASGLGLANQVALYVQGFALITLSLDRSQHFALYVQGGIQDYSVEDRTPNVFQSLLNPTQLSKCSCCPIDQLTPGGLCLTPFPLNKELNPAMRGSAHLGTRFFWRNRMT